MLKIIGLALALSLAVTPAFAQAQARPPAKDAAAKSKPQAAKPKPKAAKAKPAAKSAKAGKKAKAIEAGSASKGKVKTRRASPKAAAPAHSRGNITRPGDILKPNARD